MHRGLRSSSRVVVTLGLRRPSRRPDARPFSIRPLGEDRDRASHGHEIGRLANLCVRGARPTRSPARTASMAWLVRSRRSRTPIPMCDNVAPRTDHATLEAAIADCHCASRRTCSRSRGELPRRDGDAVLDQSHSEPEDAHEQSEIPWPAGWATCLVRAIPAIPAAEAPAAARRDP